VAFLIGALIAVAVLTFLVRIFTKRVQPEWLRAIFTVLIAYLIAGVGAGFGAGEGGFANRLDVALGGIGFVQYWAAALIVCVAWLLALILKPNDAGRSS